jgi:hypothetical protein
MNADVFAEWLRRQGHGVTRSASSYWYDAGARVLQAFPYHLLIRPSEDELLDVLRQTRAVALRYSTPLDAPLGYVSYHCVYEEPHYDVDVLGSDSRSNVRRGLKSCVVEPVSLERLAEDAWPLQMDTFARQGRKPNLSHANWRRLCLAAADLPGFEAWGGFVKGELAASLVTFAMGDYCSILYPNSRTQYLRTHVNNALSFVVTKTMMERARIRGVFYCLHSLDAPPSMDEFKFRMGFQAKPVRQRVVFAPRVAPLANWASHAVVKLLRDRLPGNTILSKAEGVLRFYLEGKRPVREQAMPERVRGLVLNPGH